MAVPSPQSMWTAPQKPFPAAVSETGVPARALAGLALTLRTVLSCTAPPATLVTIARTVKSAFTVGVS